MPKRKPAGRHRPVVWVMGASEGIGRELASQFASMDSEVCLSARSGRGLRSAVREIIGKGGRAYDFPCDIRDSAAVMNTAHRICKEVGEIDVLINNAGVTVFKPFLETSLEEFSQIIDTNLRGQIVCMKAVLPSMVRRRSGWIINVVSNAAIKVFEGSSAYTSTKAGMLGLTRVLREEMRKHHVKVVSIIPGATKTGMWSTADRARHGKLMMSATSVAKAIVNVYQMPEDTVIDEIVMRPMTGDIGS